MAAGRRFEPPDGDLLPNAETALEAAASGEPGTGVAATPAPTSEPGLPAPRRRGRPPGSKNRPKPAPDALAADALPAVLGVPDLPAADAPPVTGTAIRRRSTASARRDASRPPVARGDRLTIEQIVACDSPREPRLSPDGRRVAYTAEAGGARQVCILDLRSGATRQLTASEKAVCGPAMGARRRPPRVRPGRCDLADRGRRQPAHGRGRSSRGKPRAALGARRPADRVHLAPAWMEPGVAAGCAAAAPGPAAASSRRPGAARDHARRRGRRGPRLVARRGADRADRPAPHRPPHEPGDRPRACVGPGARRRRRWALGDRRTLAARRQRPAAPQRRGRLVPGRARHGRRHEPHRPHRRGRGARRPGRRVRDRPDPVTRRDALRPRDRPRRAPAAPRGPDDG